METEPPDAHVTLSEVASLETTPRLGCNICCNLDRALAAEKEALEPVRDLSNYRLYVFKGIWFICTYIELMRDSASAGCVYCKFIEGAIKAFAPSSNGVTRERGVTLELNESSIRIYVWRVFSFDVYWQAESISGQLESVYKHIPIRPDIDLPDSETAWNYLRNCLKICTETHNICKQKPSLPPPKRLIDVGLVGDGLVKLHETSLSDSWQYYVALSYCWGDAKFLVTKNENIESLREGISLKQLPETIRDAIHITRKLGLRYLWVDALCIIQPDKTKRDRKDWEDWEEQSGKMCSIYEQAYLTIAASSVSSAHQSFLGHSSRPRRFQYRIASEPGLILTARIHCASGYHGTDVPYSEPVDPIERRGWTFQEYLLPTRTISYSTDELQWHCREASICQCQEYHRVKKAPIISAGQSDLEILELWDEIVVIYTLRQLSDANDRLPALSGVRQQVERQTGWQYLAGLWTNHLIRHLLWQRNIFSTMEERNALLPAVKRSPSFSWASLDCPILPFKRKLKDFYRDVDFQEHARLIAVPLSDGDPVMLEGKLIRNVEVRYSDQGEYEVFRTPGRFEQSLIEDAQLESFDFIDSSGLPQRSVRRSSNHTNQPARKLESGNTVSLFVLASHQKDSLIYMITYHSLVLGISENGVFERLGVVNITDFESDLETRLEELVDFGSIGTQEIKLI
ncbi:HET-domain-containing protein [Annulohypoxylon truncatum]|uniref:HET-domain-containing protein n=1 Tax=Annulohypoxylon truncatum TaxID=327061 RepID=UPI0020079200|nr:HET-domain-containing protein [Annulohypoxylon truncatum]KAI1207251.1 HET-domain-containing protein [Annulohypoxylon truncatum]